MASYGTPAELLERYDERTLGQLVADDNSQVTPAALLTDANLQAALDDASGYIESACLVGNRYTTTDLAGLSGNSAKYLARLTCDLAYLFLKQRRGQYDAENIPTVQESLLVLNRLRLGERVFDVAEVKDKGNPTSAVISRQDILDQNLLRDNTRYWPVRRFTRDQT